MKFNEKLIELRKKQGLSQEELGEKLNVTRQTVSKWELGLTTPEMNKLSEMSALFGISVDDLLKGTEENKIEDEPILDNSQENKSRNKNIITIIIVILIALITFITIITIGGANKIFKMFGNINEEKNEAKNNVKDIIHESGKFISSIANDMNKNIKEDENEYKKNVTYSLEVDVGTNRGIVVKRVIDEIITYNKKHPNEIIIVTYKGETITEPKKLQEIKPNFEDGTKYEVSYEYDEQGYIKQADILNLKK